VIKLTVSSSDSTSVIIIFDENLNHVQFHAVQARLPNTQICGSALNHERVIYEPHFLSTETNTFQREAHWYRSSAV